MVNLGKLFDLITSPWDFCNVLRFPVPTNGMLTLCFEVFKRKNKVEFTDGCYFAIDVDPGCETCNTGGAWMAQPDFTMLPKGWDKLGARRVTRTVYSGLYGELAACFDPEPIMPECGCVTFEIITQDGTIREAMYSIEVEPE